MDHRFQINLRGIIDLLSNHLYSRPEVFVRELLQNAVDAITARQQRQSDHLGEIALELTAQRGKPRTLTISDNGIGLTEEELHRFLATIGETSKRDLAGKQIADFLGQFGIGLLSCFVVSDEIVVVSKSLQDGSPAVEWRGKVDGTYGVRTLNADLAPGTQVFLTCRAGNDELFTVERIRELAGFYGGLLPYPVRVSAAGRAVVVNEAGAPWRERYANNKERLQALLRFGKQAFGMHFLDAIPLQSRAGGVDGVAFVLPQAANLAARPSHRVYLKNMLLSEQAENLLPGWAFFVRAVVNADNLRPTASRESFYEDERLDASRAELGQCLRDYLIHLAEEEPARFARFLEVHQLALKALASEDEECYRLFIDYLPFETSRGRVPVRELRNEPGPIRYVGDVGQFRQAAKVAAAQGFTLVNGGYVYEADLLARIPEVFPETHVEKIDPAALAQDFGELELDEQDQVHALLEAVAEALRPFRCRPEVRRFRPTDLPAWYSAGADAGFLRSVEQAKEIADPMFAGVLDGLSARHRGLPQSQLFLNYDNALIRRLAALDRRELLRRCGEILYVQALLLGQQPLTSKELALLNQGLAGLIEGIANATGPNP